LNDCLSYGINLIDILTEANEGKPRRMGIEINPFVLVFTPSVALGCLL
jgi:hypothetical protein